MENLEKEKTSQEWEIKVKEALADSDERQMLDLAQDIAIRLAADLGQAKIMARDPETMPDEIEGLLHSRIARMAVMLDVLQLRYGDCAYEELDFLNVIEEAMKE